MNQKIFGKPVLAQEYSPRRGFLFTKRLLEISMKRKLHLLIALLGALNIVFVAVAFYTFGVLGKMVTGDRQPLFIFFGMTAFVVLAISVIFVIFIFRLWKAKARVDAIVQLGMEIARGDFTGRIKEQDNDEWQSLAAIFNKIIESLQEIIKKFRDAGLRVTQSAFSIHLAVEQQVAGASEQSSAVAQVTTTMSEFSATAAHIAEFAENVTKTAENASSGMQVVNSKVNKTAKRILTLGEKSQSISKIVNLIDSMAEQTNLLALNAAIEAARAGEAGRGFAIVAKEVRKLAERAKESTEDIRKLITEIQAEMNATIMGIEELTKGVSGESEKAKELSQVAKEIFVAVRQQQDASDQVAQALKNIDIVTKEAVISTKDVVASIEELNQLSEGLKSTMSKFKLGDKEQASELIL